MISYYDLLVLRPRITTLTSRKSNGFENHPWSLPSYLPSYSFNEPLFFLLGSQTWHVPIRRKCSVEQVGVTIEFYGGELNVDSYNDPATVNKYARHAQLGEIFELDRATLKFDGVFRSSTRG
ncbi:hypothetical protein KY290_010240 [Solanum tuberosum]|uniref:Uncharacterized protein n=1 Tax=Solanum tuberosum TaxID=4113 RepID=A0ABQ7VX81_SOLTU|nr:hypothetical protein KY289_010627 [Solanum tuberosum]KAH0773103.1 hypothetical protein KY290_010240 [Solanum tuberosum]